MMGAAFQAGLDFFFSLQDLSILFTKLGDILWTQFLYFFLNFCSFKAIDSIQGLFFFFKDSHFLTLHIKIFLYKILGGKKHKSKEWVFLLFLIKSKSIADRVETMIMETFSLAQKQ